MNMRPRFNEWLPFSTQQMRLRNLMRIEGHNIETQSSDQDQDTKLYYSLHANKESEAFFKSEALPQRHMQQKWAEINCEEIFKSNSNCLCVIVWAEIKGRTKLHTDEKTEVIMDDVKEKKQEKEPISALSQKLSTVASLSPNRLPRPLDRYLFSWGVYLSGLVQLNKHSNAELAPNSLVFQINGDFFTSPDYITNQSLSNQLALSYDRFSASLSRPSWGDSEIDLGINSPPVSRSSSPVNVHNRREMIRMVRTRFMQILCNISNVRKSYNLKQLLHIQELQRLQIHKQRDCIEIAEEIKQQSLSCITSDQLIRKRRTTSSSLSSSYHHHHQQHSMGRTLSVLLAEQHQIDPQALLQAKKLLRQLEISRSRHKILQLERQKYHLTLQHLKEKLSNLVQNRQKHSQRLELLQEQLKKEELTVSTNYLEQQLIKRHILANVERRMSALCVELKEIYPIGRNQHGFDTICNIPIPNLDAYCMDAKYAHSISEHVSPMALSACLGYIAHLAQMMAVIIDRPLRNPIIHEGSRTRIADIIKDIPTHSSREFPLYSRSSIPSKPVKYAIYLLNQNIAQLCYDITGINCDLRCTIRNIMELFSTLSHIELQYSNDDNLHRRMTETMPGNRLLMHEVNDVPNQTFSTQSAESVDIAFNGSIPDVLDGCEDLSKSHSSVDLNHEVPALMKHAQLLYSMPMTITQRINEDNEMRSTRSMGSYSDSEDNFKTALCPGHSLSDSNLKIAGDRNHI